MKDHLIIGSRGSRLALWQAEWVKARLEAIDPRRAVRIEIIKTSGDVIRDVPLSVIGGQGVFTKELEQALLDGRVDIAVHSLKDLPTIVPEGLAITAIPAREDARDALVLRADAAASQQQQQGAQTPPPEPKQTDAQRQQGAQSAPPSIRNLPVGARVGTSSLRRMAQLKHLRPDLTIKDLRGNVDTRLRKLDEGEYDAVILAAAGLRRLGFAHRISAPVSHEEMLPAVSQGALGVETRADDEATNHVVRQLDDPPTRKACAAERALLRSLGGGCQVPIAAHATVEGDVLRLEALVAALSGERVIRERIEGDSSRPEQLGEALSARLQERGANSLLDSVPA